MKTILKQLASMTLSAALGAGMVLAMQAYPHLQPDHAAFAALPSVRDNEQAVIDVYRQVSPAVVNIRTISLVEDFFFDPVPREGAGSGFVIDKTGNILSNNHVIAGARQMEVTFGDSTKPYPARLVGTDPKTDLAVIRVDAPASMLVPARLGDSNKLAVGQAAIAIGNPFGVLGRTVTTGVISALGRDIRVKDKIMEKMIQTDASINQGNSGGPLLNSHGEVIGINSMIYTPSGGSIGIGFAIPVNTARKLIPDLINKGRVSYPWFGIKAMDLDAERAEAFRLPAKKGILVFQAVPGGSAAKAGIKGGNRRIWLQGGYLYLGGDILTAVDGLKLTTVDELTNYLEKRKKVGDTVTVTLLRNGKSYKVPVKLQERPPE